MTQVRIIFKKETIVGPGGENEIYQRPDFETTLDNLPNQERMHGDKIKEVIRQNADGTWPTKKPAQTTIFKPKFTIKDVTPEISEQILKEAGNVSEITNEVLIKEFRKRGKTDLSIAKYLEIEIDEMKKV